MTTKEPYLIDGKPSGSVQVSDDSQASSIIPPGQELQHLLGPITPETFLKEYWQVKPLYIKGTPDKFKNLMDRERFYEAIHRASALGHAPTFHLNALMRNDEDNPLILTKMSQERVSAEEIDELMARGVTICVNDITVGDRQLAEYAWQIQAQLAYIGLVKFNCYLSPDDSGADTHFDARVSTTLQIEGRKRWRFSSAPAMDWPLSNAQVAHDGSVVWVYPWVGNEEWEKIEEPDESTFMEVVLEPGDFLCLPAGTWHDAKAIGGSLALNLTFDPMDFFKVLTKMLDPVFTQNPGWRASPPPAVIEGRAEDMPPNVERYFAERLHELRTYLDRLDPAGDSVQNVWRTLIKR